MENLASTTCPHCQKIYDAGYSFCPGCGLRSGDQAEAQRTEPSSYGWIWQEPGAFSRFYRIGLGLSAWGLLMLLSVIPIVSLVFSVVGPTFFDSEHEHSINWLTIAAGGGIILVLQVLVFALSLGGILRLLRDVVRDALHLPVYVTPVQRERRGGRVAALAAGAALLLAVVTVVVIPHSTSPLKDPDTNTAGQNSPGRATDDNLSKVRSGMTEMEVEQLLGPPAIRVSDTWTWTGEFGTFDVRFSNKKVVESGFKNQP